MKLFLNSIYLLSLSAFLAITNVKGQNSPSCIKADETATAETFYSAQTIYNILCTANTETAIPDPTASFTTFCELINDYNDIQEMLNDTTAGITVFAVVNSGLSGIDTYTNQQKRRILEAHIYDQEMYLDDLKCGEVMQSVNPDQSRKNQKSKTVCESGGVGGQYQIGPCNVDTGNNRPQIGGFSGVTFVTNDETLGGLTFTSQANGWSPNQDRYANEFDVDVQVCNGIIHSLNQAILPADVGVRNCRASAPSYYGQGPSKKNNKKAKGGKKGKGNKGGPPKGGSGRNNYYNDNGGYYNNYNNYYGRRLDEDDEDEDDVEDDIEDDEEAEVDEIDDSSSSQERHDRLERRKRVLETLIEPNGDVIEQVA